jgi:hypothetical protein
MWVCAGFAQVSEYSVSSTAQCIISIPASCLRCAGMVVNIDLSCCTYSTLPYICILWLLSLIETHAYPGASPSSASLPVAHYSGSIRTFEPVSPRPCTSFMPTEIPGAGESFSGVSQTNIHHRFATQKLFPVGTPCRASLSRFGSGALRSIAGSRYRYGCAVVGSTYRPVEGLISGWNTGNGNSDGEMEYAGRSCTCPFLPRQP